MTEAIELMRGVVSRSEFFERYRHDPEVIRRLDIRRDPARARSLNCDRKALLEWIDEVRSEQELALESDANARNLAKHSVRRRARRASTEYGVHMASLVEARNKGWISEEQFGRAVADLECRD